MRQGGGELQLQPACLGVHEDGAVAEEILGVPVRGQEPPLGRPTCPPLALGELGNLQMMARPGEPAAAPAHRHPAISKLLLDSGQQRLQVLQALLLGPPPLAGGIPAGRTTPPTDRHHQPPLDHPDRPAETSANVQQVKACPLPLVVAGAGDRPRPPRRRRRCQGTLTVGAAVGAQSNRAAAGEVAAGQPTQVLANHAQYRGVLPVGPQPGAHPRTCGRGDHKRGNDRTHDRIVSSNCDNRARACTSRPDECRASPRPAEHPPAIPYPIDPEHALTGAARQLLETEPMPQELWRRVRRLLRIGWTMEGGPAAVRA
jgi:hypothetical protein